MTQSKQTTAHDVLLYVPNLIGYSRVLFTVGSLFLMMVSPQYWFLATLLYIASFVGDLFDGLVARKLNQTSTFGGLLDMVTDRCSTLGLLFVLSGDYTKYDIQIGFPVFRCTFLSLVLLDISSHWCQMYSTSVLGQHHKSDEGNEGRNFLVRWFYKYYYFFGYLCVGAEFSYILAYVLQFEEELPTWSVPFVKFSLAALLPGCVMKQAVNVAQLQSACYAVAEHDAAGKNK
eukprot:Nitzschia sp. Nitz4//scaffold22_size323478//306168//306929//NITZ4_000592-RA/size323478-augustus-gene-0.217-mRNA-1//1//CDS//3329543192//1716//frame0